MQEPLKIKEIRYKEYHWQYRHNSAQNTSLTQSWLFKDLCRMCFLIFFVSFTNSQIILQ